MELVLTDEASRVAAGRTRLGAETGRKGTVFKGKLASVENVVAIHIGYRNLGGGDEEFVRAVNTVGVLLEFGQLTGAVMEARFTR